jgi:hypothetical protein
MKVRGQDQRPLLISGVDQAVQRLGLVGTRRQQPDVVHDHKLRADDPFDESARAPALGDAGPGCGRTLRPTSA